LVVAVEVAVVGRVPMVPLVEKLTCRVRHKKVTADS